MKKSVFIFIGIILSICILAAIIKIHGEENEILNNDVSLSDIKSITEIESDSPANIEEVPVGYKDGNIYILKYDKNSEKYDKTIYVLNNDGSLYDSDIQLSDDYTYKNLSIYGSRVFGKHGYMDCITGEDNYIFDYSGEEVSKWYSVSGNKNYFIAFVENQNEYYLCDIENDKKYKLSCSENDKYILKGSFYDEISDSFYAVMEDNTVKKININDETFSFEDYDALKDNDNKDSLDYVFCTKGYMYYDDNNNISQYNVSSKHIEKIDDMIISDFDKYFKDYILLKKNNDDNLYFAKFDLKSFEILMKVPIYYGSDSKVTVHMIDNDYVLFNEHNDDKAGNKNHFAVYDMLKYYNENKYSKDQNGNWLTQDSMSLIDAYKNINENKSEDVDKSLEKNKHESLDNNMSNMNNNKNKSSDNINNNNVKNNRDFREDDPSWHQVEGKWHYKNDDNKDVVGWVKTKKGYYYFFTDGTMVKNAIVKEGDMEYVIGEDGLLVDNNNDEVSKPSDSQCYDATEKQNEKDKLKNTDKKTDIYN